MAKTETNELVAEIDAFKSNWKKNNATHGIDEPFPDYVVDYGWKIKNFMIPENRKYQGALGNSKGMLEGISQYARTSRITDSVKFFDNINVILDFLLKVRLTSQVPLNTSFFIMQKLRKLNPPTLDIETLKTALQAECDFHLRNYSVARDKIAKLMSARIVDRCEEYEQPKITIGTHCHSGAVIKAIINSKEYIKQVVVSKTEPEQQGMITAKELCEAGVKVKLIALEQYGVEFRRVNMFLFGIDAVSVEGIVLNKSGTRMIATLAHTKELPVYFLGETYKYARETLYGNMVHNERRDVTEHLLSNRLGIDLHKCLDSGMLDVQFTAFDTTKPEFYNSIVSEQGFMPLHDAFEKEWKEYL
jgi:translation initiation factor 2B subunit (eIF-2B alpha/beta/delta family)